VFYTLVNLYLFSCFGAIVAFELYANVFRERSMTVAGSPLAPNRDARPRRKGQARRR